MFTFLLGFALAAACLLNKIKAKKLFNSIFIALLILYSVKTISRNTAWKDDFTLFTTDVKTSVNSGRMQCGCRFLILDKAKDEKDTGKQNEQYLAG